MKRKTSSAKRPETLGPDWPKGSLAGKVAVVAGASRGAGRGIALALGEAGATVYVAGRTARGGPKPSDGAPGTVEDTAEEVTRRGGRGVAVRADCSLEADVAALFERVKQEQGSLDVLANAVWSLNEFYAQGGARGTPFWELPEASWRGLMATGAHSHLLTVMHAARLMAPAGRGLIASVTEPEVGLHRSLFWMSWTLGHRAINLMVDAMSRDLRKRGVTIVALAPGFMRTERVLMHLKTDKERKAHGLDKSESTEYVGRAAAALAADPKVRRHGGKLLYVADLARSYGFTDVDGTQVANFYRVMKLIK